GVASPTARVPSPALWIRDMWQFSSLRNISESTGGLSAIHTDVGKALDRVDIATRSQYLLGYYPKDDRWDGRYRHIDVRINRPGVKVHFRHGYFARDFLEPYDRGKFLAYSRISAAAGHPGTDIKDVRFEMSAVEAVAPDGEKRVRVDLRIDPAGIGFRTANGLHTARLHISFFYADRSRRHLGDDWQVFDLSMREAEFRQALENGVVSYSTLVSLKAPRQIIKAVVYDAARDRLGVAQLQLR
ncbi:MAG: hypothetical protein ABIG68_09935, partial [Acidobacteriota bacterium]